MTSIAWDGKRLAADGRCTAGNRVVADDMVKIHMDGSSTVRGSMVICYALAGAADLMNIVGDWIAEGCPVDKDLSEKEFECLIITVDDCFVYCKGSNDIFRSPGYETLGSGGEFAMSALHFGKNAIESVQHAASIDIFSGGEGAYVTCRDVTKAELKGFKT